MRVLKKPSGSLTAMQTKYKNAVVWTQKNSVECSSAVTLLKARGYIVDERVIGLGGEYTKQDLLKQLPDARSVPQIFIDGNYIGDFQNLRTFLAYQ